MILFLLNVFASLPSLKSIRKGRECVTFPPFVSCQACQLTSYQAAEGFPTVSGFIPSSVPLSTCSTGGPCLRTLNPMHDMCHHLAQYHILVVSITLRYQRYLVIVATDCSSKCPASPYGVSGTTVICSSECCRELLFENFCDVLAVNTLRTWALSRDSSSSRLA